MTEALQMIGTILGFALGAACGLWCFYAFMDRRIHRQNPTPSPQPKQDKFARHPSQRPPSRPEPRILDAYRGFQLSQVQTYSTTGTPDQSVLVRVDGTPGVGR